MRELFNRIKEFFRGAEPCDCQWNLCSDCTDWIRRDNW